MGPMLQISPYDSIDHAGLPKGDETNFWRVKRHGELDCFTATFRKHVFPPHTHETYVIGTIVEGIHSYEHRGRMIRSGPGTVCFINPDEVHDGSPDAHGYSYRMTYPSEAFLASIISEAAGRPSGPPRFRVPNQMDVELSERFIRLHQSLEGRGDALLGDERLIDFFLTAIARYAGLPALETAGNEPSSVRQVKEILSELVEDPPELATLSRMVGLSPFHLIRVFRKATGLTPHAWLVDHRINRARDLLREGVAPSDVAVRCGFADQAHLTRLFKARLGIPPGQYRQALN
ncbi:MAG: AraC family ligand binding domain-containing protein [Parvibaculaceae bacterium]